MIVPLLQVIVRGVVAAVVVVVFTAIWLFSGIPYGGGSRDLAYLAAFVFFLGVGWAFLPLFRASKVIASALVVSWLALGVKAHLFGAPSVKGWMFMPWLTASGALVLMLGVPSLLRRAAEVRETDDEV